MALSIQDILEVQWNYSNRRKGFERFVAMAGAVIEQQLSESQELRGDDLHFTLFGESFRLRFRFIASSTTDKIILQRFSDDDGTNRWFDVGAYADDFSNVEANHAQASFASRFQRSVEKALLELIESYVDSTSDELDE